MYCTALLIAGVLGNGVISFLKMHKMDKTILNLGEETKTLSQNIHADVATLDARQKQIMAVLKSLLSQPGGRNSSEADMVKLINETISRLDKEKTSKATLGVLDNSTTQSKAREESIQKQVKQTLGVDDLYAKPSGTESAPQTTSINSMLTLLQQIRSDVEKLTKSQSDIANDIGKRIEKLEERMSASSSWESLSNGLSSVGGGLSSLGSNAKQAVGGFVSSYTSGGIGGTGSKEDASGIAGSGSVANRNSTGVFTRQDTAGNTARSNAADSRSSVSVSSSSNVPAVRKSDPGSGEGGQSWQRKVVYFGACTVGLYVGGTIIMTLFGS